MNVRAFQYFGSKYRYIDFLPKPPSYDEVAEIVSKYKSEINVSWYHGYRVGISNRPKGDQ